MSKIFWKLYLIPSAYGLLVWGGLLCIAPLNFIEVKIELPAWFVFFYLFICFFLSCMLFSMYGEKKSIAEIGEKINYGKLDKILFVFSTIVGVYGLFLYVIDFSKHFGGLLQFFVMFFADPLEIRALAAEETSLGFQVSYFSWVSIFYIIYFISKKNLKNFLKKYLLILILLIEIFLNLLFVDRTRPVILLIVCFLSYIILNYKSLKNPGRILCYVFLGPVVIFFAQAIFTGKYDSDSGVFNNFLIYVFGGFGYLSQLLNDVIPSYELTRTFYPISKILEALGFISNVPSQILEFRDIPFTTNVGTFLEPIISDAGWLGVIFGIPVLIFSIDFIGYISLRSNNILGLFIWGNMVLINILSFFVPKYNATSLLLFFLLFFSSSVFGKNTSKGISS